MSFSALRNLKGNENCNICGGKGTHTVNGTIIFCTSCLSEEKVSMIYQYISQRISKGKEGKLVRKF